MAFRILCSAAFAFWWHPSESLKKFFIKYFSLGLLTLFWLAFLDRASCKTSSSPLNSKLFHNPTPLHLKVSLGHARNLEWCAKVNHHSWFQKLHMYITWVHNLKWLNHSQNIWGQFCFLRVCNFLFGRGPGTRLSFYKTWRLSWYFLI